MIGYFNPLSPCGERQKQTAVAVRTGDFNPLSPCGERPPDCQQAAIDDRISIHSPHAGRDDRYNKLCEACGNFNPLSPCGERLYDKWRTHRMDGISIHSPHAGRDDIKYVASDGSERFQSTLPMRGETRSMVPVRS